MDSCSDVSVVVPFRNRHRHLHTWIKEVRDKMPSDTECIVVEQVDARKFNRGLLLNVGYNESSRSRVIFHDCDLIPDRDLLQLYSSPWPAPVVHFGHRFSRYNNSKRYFGGVTGFVRDSFPGFSNKYFGWGGEDDSLYNRCKHFHIRRPTTGSYTDLEFLPHARNKLQTLTKDTKCMDKWELLKADDVATDNHRTIPESVSVSKTYNRAYKCVWLHVFIE